MNLDDTVTLIIEDLSDFPWNNSKELLNRANEILYPLKESKEIFHYYFSFKEEGSEVLLTLFLQEKEDSLIESFELSISKEN